MLNDSVRTAYVSLFTFTEPAKNVAFEVFVRMWLAQHRHRVHSYRLLTTTLVPPKVTPRDEPLAPSAQPDVAVRLSFPLRHEAVNFHIGALCSYLHDIGVKGTGWSINYLSQ